MNIYVVKYQLKDMEYPKTMFYTQWQKAITLQESLNLNRYTSELFVLDSNKEYYDLVDQEIKEHNNVNMANFYTGLINSRG